MEQGSGNPYRAPNSADLSRNELRLPRSAAIVWIVLIAFVLFDVGTSVYVRGFQESILTWIVALLLVLCAIGIRVGEPWSPSAGVALSMLLFVMALFEYMFFRPKLYGTLWVSLIAHFPVAIVAGLLCNELVDHEYFRRTDA